MVVIIITIPCSSKWVHISHFSIKFTIATIIKHDSFFSPLHTESIFSSISTRVLCPLVFVVFGLSPRRWWILRFRDSLVTYFVTLELHTEVQFANTIIFICVKHTLTMANKIRWRCYSLVIDFN